MGFGGLFRPLLNLNSPTFKEGRNGATGKLHKCDFFFNLLGWKPFLNDSITPEGSQEFF